MNQDWLRQRERGNWVTIRGMVWTARCLGRPAARVLLYPICAYYLVVSSAARQAISRFLETVLARPVTWRDLFHQYHHFASTILDRVYLLTGRQDRFHIAVHGLDALGRHIDQRRGCVLLGSHLGSFEIVRAIGFSRRDLEIRVLMHEENGPLIRDLVRGLNPAVADSVIPVGTPDAMLRVKECLDRGGIVGIMGDRLIGPEQGTACKFFGRLLRFPTGTMRLLGVLGVPVIVFFGLYRGGHRYDVHFELFADQITLDAEQRDEQIHQWTQRYVDRLERYCRLAPDNWFNFYDVWEDGA
ncbi:MAG: LpxL/LpxP family acyltransferase [Nitrospiraceae bacterium]